MKSKTNLRNFYKNARHVFISALSDVEREVIFDKIIDQISILLKDKTYQSISAYIAKEGEVSLLPFLKNQKAIGKTIILPYFEERDEILTFKEWDTVTPLKLGAFGTYQPSKLNTTIVPDIVILPMLAFDRKCHRLGYGKGHFDRTLGLLKKSYPVVTIGVAFSFQERDSLPIEDHDVSLDFIVTEKDIFKN